MGIKFIYNVKSIAILTKQKKQEQKNDFISLRLLNQLRFCF